MEGEVALFPCLFKISKLMVRLCGCFTTETNFFIFHFTFCLTQICITEAKEEISLIYIKPLLFSPNYFMM